MAAEPDISDNNGWENGIIDRDGKELPIGKTHLDNVLRAMTEGET